MRKHKKKLNVTYFQQKQDVGRITSNNSDVHVHVHVSVKTDSRRRNERVLVFLNECYQKGVSLTDWLLNR